MAWSLKGTYFETCSCDVVCPCTASLSLGATYDRCCVTLVFNIVDGKMKQMWAVPYDPYEVQQA